MLSIILLIIFSPAILIAGFVSLCIIWSIIDFILSLIIDSINNLSKNINNLRSKKE